MDLVLKTDEQVNLTSSTGFQNISAPHVRASVQWKVGPFYITPDDGIIKCWNIISKWTIRFSKFDYLKISGTMMTLRIQTSLCSILVSVTVSVFLCECCQQSEQCVVPHSKPTSLACVHVLLSGTWKGQLKKSASLPVQSTRVMWIGPPPGLVSRPLNTRMAEAYPICRQITRASRISQRSSHTVPHFPPRYTSRRPEYVFVSRMGRPVDREVQSVNIFLFHS